MQTVFVYINTDIKYHFKKLFKLSNETCSHFIFNLASYCEYTEFSIVDNLYTFKCYKEQFS